MSEPAGSGQVPDSAGQVPVSGAAEILGVSERTVRRYLSLGKLESVPGSKPLQVTLEALEALQRKPAGAGQVPDGAAGGTAADLVAVLRAQVEDLQRRLDESEAERRSLTEQKDRALWAAVEASRLIEAGPAAPVATDEADETPPTARKRRFWRWLR
jgi:hypothetical protein